MLLRLLTMGLIVMLSRGWCQPADPDAWATRGKTMLAQFDRALEMAKKTGEKISPEDLEKFGHLKSYAQSLADRQWNQSFQEVRWLADHDDFPPQFQLALGVAQLSGIGTPKDPQAAVRTFENAAHEGVVGAMENLGLAYERSGYVSQDLELAFHWYQMAADRGSKTGQRYLARAYGEGLGVKPDPEEARWYTDITSGPKPQTDLDADVTRAVLKRAGAEVQPAIQAFDQGRLLDARTMFQRLADKGDAYAQAMLGEIYLEGKGVPKNPAKAVELLKSAADSENPLAQWLLGTYYFGGIGVPKNLALAQKNLAPAAETGWRGAQYLLAKIYVSQNKRDQAKTWLRAAADRGYSKAQEELAMMLIAEKEPASTIEALKWFVLLAQDAGNAGAAAIAGRCYLDPTCTTPNLAEAFRWLDRAALAGIAGAQFELGNLYWQGNGIQKDLAQAARWFRAAADQGDAGAQNNLGELYRFGEGLAADNREAAKWYFRSARQKNGVAFANLAQMYEKNSIPPSDVGTSSTRIATYMFYELAARNGYAKYNAKRDGFYAALTPAEKAEAVKTLADWEKRYPSRQLPAATALQAGPPPPTGVAPIVAPKPIPREIATIREEAMPPQIGAGSGSRAGVPGATGVGAPGGVGGGVYRVPPPTPKQVLPLLPCGQPLKTEKTGKGVKLTFRNDGAEERSLLSIDNQGQSKPSGTVPSRQQRVMASFEGQVWMVVDRDGSCAAYFRAEEQDALAAFGKN